MSVANASGVIPSRLKAVPPFPPVAARLLTLFAEPADGLQIKSIAALIESDPTFSARILQQANSAESTVLTQVKNIRHALVVLGLERARQTTVTVAMSAYSKAALRTAELRQCWRHTIATAVLADGISRKTGVFMELAYAAGLMHDIGRLGLLVAYPREYEATIRDAASRCLDLIDFERETFGLDHEEAGRWLAEKWRLPDEMQVIAGRHHDPCEGAEISLLRIVHTACNLADSLGYFVTKPLVDRTLEQVLAELPEQARRAIAAEACDLVARVEAKIAEFDSTDSREVQAAPEIAAPVETVDASFLIDLPAGVATADAERKPTLWSRLLNAVRSLFLPRAPATTAPQAAAGAKEREDVPITD
ncbi:MAG: HDOD domain-containing protein [Bryobacteraceae bacterium]|nr:HDOD domain-containing protein [Bryobacteraceae bacterium]